MVPLYKHETTDLIINARSKSLTDRWLSGRQSLKNHGTSVRKLLLRRIRSLSNANSRNNVYLRDRCRCSKLFYGHEIRHFNTLSSLSQFTRVKCSFGFYRWALQHRTIIEDTCCVFTENTTCDHWFVEVSRRRPLFRNFQFLLLLSLTLEVERDAGLWRRLWRRVYKFTLQSFTYWNYYL